MRPHQLTPEQLALSQERRLKKQQKQEEDAKRAADQKEWDQQILARQWVQLQDTDCGDEINRVRVFSWNLLAQCLVRRELFPESDCLKTSQREPMLYREILSHQAHILCLQEVDRLDELVPVLDNAGYSHVYAAGPGKLHGCLIGFDQRLYFKVKDKVIYYDQQEVGENRRGCSIRTSNIALLIALAPHGGGQGLIVATTHLFWHPRYAYERARQAGILVREVVQFRNDIRQSDWPCIIGGDFNFAPDEAAYSLLVGDPVLPTQEEALSTSRVIHVSIETGAALRAVPKTAEDKPATDPDKVITDARPALPEDGLLTTDELVTLYSTRRPLQSAYDRAQYLYRAVDATLPILSDRLQFLPHRRGAHEPMWTSYTYHWKTVLDYIFILDPEHGKHSAIAAFLKPPRTEELYPGLPKLGVSGSDHIPLCVDLMWEDGPR